MLVGERVGAPLPWLFHEMCLWREVSTPQVRLWFLWCTTLFLSKMTCKQWYRHSVFKKVSFLPRTAVHILSHPTPPQLHPAFAPRTDPRADLRCAAPFLLPPGGARRRRCRHLQQIRGSSGVQASIVGGQRELQVSLAEKIPLSFFFPPPPPI